MFLHGRELLPQAGGLLAQGFDFQATLFEPIPENALFVIITLARSAQQSRLIEQERGICSAKIGKVFILATDFRAQPQRLGSQRHAPGFQLIPVGAARGTIQSHQNIASFHPVAIAHQHIADDAAFQMLDCVDRTTWDHGPRCARGRGHACHAGPGNTPDNEKGRHRYRRCQETRRAGLLKLDRVGQKTQLVPCGPTHALDR